ncbi:MAG TPA: isoleucine--tRNA ligase [Streptosporangiaceae bacterium]|nr:isoleucine--tRNA ligase [Streptosporangiaceae bacterium]
MPFPELPGSVDLPALERDILRRWADGKVFRRSLEQTAGGERWIFYEGPPTANGMPGVHHIEARVFKDAFPRFKTMQGYHVPRRAGWDCHGLPVEVAVEKELGLTAKRDIEAYGIAAFNARCRESVLRHVDAFAELTRRMGYWIDLSTAYKTMDPAYIESVWWSLQQIYRQGLLVRDHRISPYCPRCGTPLSDHEMGQPDVYRTVTDPSVIVRFPLRDLPPGGRAELRGADLLVWTTTPWTLVSNTAVAVHPGEVYAVARRAGHGDRVVVADNLAARVLGEGWHVTARMRGSELAGATYQPPFSLVEVAGAHRVVPASFVTTQDGTGLVHLAPAFGADDLAAGREHGLPVVNPVRPDGRFDEGLPLVGGLFFKAADRPLIRDLDDRGLLFRSEGHEHSYPHCWRCGTPLLYYAMPSWFIRTTAIKDQLLEQNARTNWQPPSIRDGRYGEWLRSNVDWALSRTRYWGTPLPLWQCPSGHVTCVGSLAELSELAGTDLTGLDPHRPFVDDVLIGCPDCHEPARRVPEVIDVWYDSGSMPFAQFGAPLRDEAEFRRSYPAQFICEAIDQTRGWFYSLMAVGTLVFGRSAYENVVCLGLIADEQGRKMSKHLGNVLEPLPLLEAHGADALRWFFFAAGSPWATRKIGSAALEEIVRKVLLTYWNTVSFLVRYANAGAAGGQAWTPAALAAAPPPASRPALDRWLLSELNAVVRDVTAALEAFDSAASGRRIAAFIDDLSNWYVRRSRRRFWEGPGTPGGAAAFATLYTALETLTRLMAPVTPFLTDYLWGVLHGTAGDPAPGSAPDPAPGSAPDSVHLAAWPAADASLIDAELAGQMALARRLVELGRAARASAVLPVRQPLARALAGAAGFAALPAELRHQVADELNVRVLEQLDAASGELVSYTVRPSYRALGRRFGKDTPLVAAAVEAADPAVLAAELGSAGSAAVRVAGVPGEEPGGLVRLAPEDVTITQTPRAGWAVASDNGETVALETAITPELLREGYARQVIRLVSEARKRDGLAVSDRIELRWATEDPELARALAEHGALVSTEVLATSYGPAAGGSGPASGEVAAAGVEHADTDLRLTFWIRRA